MATRYKKYLEKMLEENKDVFDSFKRIHHKYALDTKTNQGEFNDKGEKILEIIQEYENRLCANQERGMYNKFSTGLSEKFRSEVKKIFPMIDHVGLKIEKAPLFNIKKIKLF